MSKQRLSVHSVDTPIQNLPLRLIDPSPYAIREKRTLTLQPTVKRLGILEPIMVRKSKAGRYQVVFGDGQLKEAKALGLKTIPSILRNCNDQEALLIHLTENLARKLHST